MSTGLTISKASYGSGSKTVDVTSAVSAKVKDGVLNFTVSPTSLNVDDPAPGQLKQIEIDYTINNGSKNTITKKDNDLVSIDAPPLRVASGLQIVKAEYGYSGNWTDVTDALQNLMKSDGSIDLKVGFKEVGLPDPNPNKHKELKVDYTINGSKSTQNLKDGERFRMDAPPREDTSNQKIGNPIPSLIWTVVMGFFHFIGAFIWILGMYTTYNIGYQAGGDVGGYLLVGTVGWIPFFTFLVMPFFIFAIRLFRSTDIIV